MIQKKRNDTVTYKAIVKKKRKSYYGRCAGCVIHRITTDAVLKDVPALCNNRWWLSGIYFLVTNESVRWLLRSDDNHVQMIFKMQCVLKECFASKCITYCNVLSTSYCCDISCYLLTNRNSLIPFWVDCETNDSK